MVSSFTPENSTVSFQASPVEQCLSSPSFKSWLWSCSEPHQGSSTMMALISSIPYFCLSSNASFLLSLCHFLSPVINSDRSQVGILSLFCCKLWSFLHLHSPLSRLSRKMWFKTTITAKPSRGFNVYSFYSDNSPPQHWCIYWRSRFLKQRWHSSDWREGSNWHVLFWLTYPFLNSFTLLVRFWESLFKIYSLQMPWTGNLLVRWVLLIWGIILALWSLQMLLIVTKFWSSTHSLLGGQIYNLLRRTFMIFRYWFIFLICR